MVKRLNSRSSALMVFGVSTVFIIFFYIILFFQADARGHVGFYILSFSANLTNLHIGCFLLLIASVIIFAQKGSRFATGALVAAIVILVLPTIIFVRSDSFVKNIFSRHLTTMSTQDHVYQLAENGPRSCPEAFGDPTFDWNTYHCSSNVSLYQCDRSGVLCSLKANTSLSLLASGKDPVQLRIEGNMIEILGDEGKVVYSTAV